MTDQAIALLGLVDIRITNGMTLDTRALLLERVLDTTAEGIRVVDR